MPDITEVTDVPTFPFGLEAARGTIPGITTVNKFGSAPSGIDHGRHRRREPVRRVPRHQVAMRVCNVPGCPTLTDQPRCPQHTRAADQARPDRGVYSKAPHRRFRRRVLKRDPLCVICGAIASVADHWPTSRRDLVAQGLDPNDPNRGRGLCAPCHNKETAAHQPGGWAALAPHPPLP